MTHRDLAGEPHGLARLNHDGVEPASDEGSRAYPTPGQAARVRVTNNLHLEVR